LFSLNTCKCGSAVDDEHTSTLSGRQEDGRSVSSLGDWSPFVDRYDLTAVTEPPRVAVPQISNTATAWEQLGRADPPLARDI